MNIISELLQELKEEYQITKQFLQHYPKGKNEYKPHEKSMFLMQLASHVVEIFAWPQAVLDKPFWDFAEPFTRPKLETKEDLLQKLEVDYAKGKDALERITLDDFDESWDIRQGEMIFMKWTKYGAIRHSLNQITHHRAQLGVYYRLNDIFVPKSYGPSADDQSFD